MPFTTPSPINSDIIKALHAEGMPFTHIRHDTSTNEVFFSEDGETFERADVWLREMVTGIPARDVAEVDPLTPTAARRDPILRSIHEAKLKDLIVYTAEYYEPALAARTPNLPLLAGAMVTVIGRSQDKLAALRTVYDRWDLIIENMVEWLIKPPRLVFSDPRS